MANIPKESAASKALDEYLERNETPTLSEVWNALVPVRPFTEVELSSVIVQRLSNEELFLTSDRRLVRRKK